jgi:hypothetical protein
VSGRDARRERASRVSGMSSVLHQGTLWSPE